MGNDLSLIRQWLAIWERYIRLRVQPKTTPRLDEHTHPVRYCEALQTYFVICIYCLLRVALVNPWRLCKYIGDWGVSPTRKSYSFRSCVRASEAACALETILLARPGCGSSKNPACVVGACPSSCRRKSTSSFSIGPIKNIFRCLSLLLAAFRCVPAASRVRLSVTRGEDPGSRSPGRWLFYSLQIHKSAHLYVFLK